MCLLRDGVGGVGELMAKLGYGASSGVMKTYELHFNTNML